MQDVQTRSNTMARKVSEGVYKNLALFVPPTCLPQFTFWSQNGGERSPSQSSRFHKWEKRGLCPREAAGVVHGLAFGGGKSLWLNSLRCACFHRQVQVLSGGISVVEENLATTKPGC